MVLTIFILINIFLVSYYLKGKRNLHILEVFAYWCFVAILLQNYSAIADLNFEVIHFPGSKSLDWTVTINRVVLFPIIIIFYLDWYSVSNKFQKGFLSILFLNILWGMEWISIKIGLLNGKDNYLPWTYLFYLFILMITLIFMKSFRRYFYKRG